MEYTDTDGQKWLLLKDIAVMLDQKIWNGDLQTSTPCARINLHALHCTSGDVATVKELVDHQKTIAAHSGNNAHLQKPFSHQPP